MLDNQFKTCNFNHESIIGVQSEVTYTDERTALDFMVNQDAISFGSKTNVPGGPEGFVVRSFLAENYLYVLSTDDMSGHTEVIRYFAPHGLTINEVRLISKWHHKTQLDF